MTAQVLINQQWFRSAKVKFDRQLLPHRIAGIKLKTFFFRKQPEADKLKNKFNDKDNEEKLPWHDVSGKRFVPYNIPYQMYRG